MVRVAYLSPLPPAATGVAGYSKAVLDRLRATGFDERHELVARMPKDLDDGDGLVRESDVAVYHIGNNLRYHREIYALAVRHPGLVVLHDLALDDFAEGLSAVDDPLAHPTGAEARAAAPRLAHSDLHLDGPLETPWCAYLVRRSRGVIVHAPFGRRYLEAFGSRTPVFVVPHTPVPEVAGWRAARAERWVRRRLGGRGPVIGVLGDIGKAKAIDAVLDAVARLEFDFVVAIVGRRIPGFDVGAEVRRRQLGYRAVVQFDVTDADFGAWLRASDVVVNLRHPHRGEVSGTLIQASQLGIPSVVSATGTYLDWPADAVARIPPGPPDPEALADALRDLLRDTERRRVIGEQARAYVEGLAGEEATAAGYASAIEATLDLLRDPARAALVRWAEVLTDVGMGPVGARRGLGTRYVESLQAFRPGAEDLPTT
jgi:glycosyltransferase involved in cell wall biosynthesis